MRKLDELMGTYREKKNQWEPLDEARTDEILDRTLEKLCMERKMKMNVKKKITITLLAGILGIGLLTAAGAATYLSLDKDFLKFLNPVNDEQVQKINSSGVAINKQAEHDGYIIDVKQSIGDKHQMYVLFDVIAPEGTVLDQDTYSFDAVRLWSDKNKAMGYGVNMLKDEDPTDNKISMVLEASSNNGFSGDTVKLDLENLRYYVIGEDGGMVTVAEGAWSVSFDLKYQDISKTYKMNVPVEIYGGNAAIKSISVSPLSITVEAKGPAIHAYDQAAPEERVETEEEISVTMKNGQVLEFITGGTSTNAFTMIKTCTYDRMLDVEQIASIHVFGKDIPLNQ